MSLYKIDHLWLPSRPQVKIWAQRLIDVGRSPKQASSVNDGTYRPLRTFPFKRRVFHTEIAHISIGMHNEHFLHHRCSGSCHFYCRLLWFACLNMEWRIRLAAAIATIPFRDD